MKKRLKVEFPGLKEIFDELVEKQNLNLRKEHNSSNNNNNTEDFPVTPVDILIKDNFVEFPGLKEIFDELVEKQNLNLRKEHNSSNKG